MPEQITLRIGLLLVAFAVTNPASAQTATFSNRFPQSPPQTTARVAPTPPVVRRQLRATDAPPAADDATKSNAEREALEDEALNRTISGICRGC